MGNSDVRFVQVATTFDAAEEAESLASSAVRRRRAACAQAEGPVTSVYRWDGAVQKDKEWRARTWRLRRRSRHGRVASCAVWLVRTGDRSVLRIEDHKSMEGGQLEDRVDDVTSAAVPQIDGHVVDSSVER